MGETNGNGQGDKGSKFTVLLAGGANLVIAVAKAVGGIMSGSSAMMSEAAHSVADTLNQVFLMTAIHRSAKQADPEHPFGYGMERYFWSLLAAVGIFVLGAGFSAFEGLHQILSPEEQKGVLVPFIVLAVAFLMESTSLVRGLWQSRSEARERGKPLKHWLMHEAEPTVRAVVFEDSAAVAGLVVAAAGIGLDYALHTTIFDAIASFVIAAVLIVAAYGLGAQNRDYLIGRAVPPDVLTEIKKLVEETDGIEHVVQLLTLQLGPGQVLVAARAEVDPGAPGSDLEQVADEVDRRICESFPDVHHVFLDPTPGAVDQPQGDQSQPEGAHR
ncbi:MAG TPA: cation diffusion facilitator family transporter [Marmoricola sp.]|nr:cation diffusion facilitator family transporter [Marmoricola sp.]